MPKLAANLTMLWNELDFLERFAAAQRAGFKAVEYLFPYAYEKQRLVDQLGQNGLFQALHNLPAGDWAKGERGIACLPERRGEFRDGVGLAIDYAKVLSCPKLNCLVGIAPAGADAEGLQATLVDNLKFAAAELGKAGILLLVEPINTRDIPGFFVNRTRQALALLEAVGSPNLFLQYDIYHMQIMEGDLGPTIQRNISRIQHVQIADNPGRNEPGTGEINHAFLFKLLDELKYDGFIGCEYKPKTRTDEGLAWAKPYL
ncbi:MAG TPA: hydroxypyruvate isomerase [Polyangiaceae bacterium]|nr:hydroxypyruvate isomerase [Polyangiaceae bacterium]